jgi:hypothetical protein
MYVGDYLLTIICGIVIFLSSLIIWIYIAGARTDYSRMRKISIDGGHISINKNNEIEINRPIFYGFINNGCFFPTMLIFIIFAIFITDFPLNSLSKYLSHFGLFTICLLFLLLIIFGIIRIYNNRSNYGRIIFNVNLRQVVFLSSSSTGIPFSEITGIYQESFPMIHPNFLRVVFFLKNKENVPVELLSISGERKTVIAKANYIEGLLKTSVSY